MMESLPVAPLAALSPAERPLAGPAAPAAGGSGSFSKMLLDGLETVNQRLSDADRLVRAFALDENVPLHQVTFALEEARLSVEMMMQVRSRLVESYQTMMQMQL